MGIAISTDPTACHGGYTRVAEMPDRLRLVYDRIVAKLSANGYTVRANGTPVVIPRLNARIQLNGGDFISADRMPPRQRQLFEDALAAAFPLESAICAIVEARGYYGRVALRVLLLTLALEIIAAAFLATQGYFG